MTDYAVKLELPDELLQLGLALGVLKPSPVDASKTVLNVDFFSNPPSHLARVLGDAEQRAAVLKLAGQLVGDVELDLDLADVPDGQTWVPLMTSDEAPRRGLYIVTEEAGDDIRLSLGGRLAAANAELESAATLLVPLISVRGGATPTGAQALIGMPEGVIQVGMTLSLSAGGLGDGSSGIDLSGASVNVAVPTDGSEPVLGVLLRRLRLPGEAAPRDVLMSQGDELAGEAVKILVALIEGQAGSLSDELQHVFALLGLHSTPPVPELPVQDLVQDGAAALTRWLEALAGNPAAVKAWLGELAGLLGLGGAQAVAGTGSDTDPFRICKGTAPAVCATLRLGRDQVSGAPVLRPGARLAFEAGASAPVPGRVYAEAELCTLGLGADPSFEPLPALRVAAELGGPGAPLVDLDAPESPEKVRVEQLCLGLELDEERRPAALVEAHEVDLADNHYGILNLASAEAVNAATELLEDILVNLLDGLGAGAEAKALLALAGVREPAGAPSDWPEGPPLADFFAKPIESIACYHGKVLTTNLKLVGAGSTPEGAWKLLALELGRLVSPEPELVRVGGDGSAEDPWAVSVFDNTGSDDLVRGSVDLLAWVAVNEGRPTLRLAGRVAAEPLTIGDEQLTLSYTIEAASFELPAPPLCAESTVAGFITGHELRLELGDDLELSAGPLAVRVESLSASLGWTPSDGWRGGLEVEEPRVVVGDREEPLPPLDLDFGRPMPPLSLDSLPWATIEALAGHWLRTADDQTGSTLAVLLGWAAPDPGERLQLTSLAGVDLALDPAAGAAPRLSVRGLVDDPVRTVSEWVRGLLAADAGGDSLALPTLARLAGLAGSAGAAENGLLVAPVTGTGSGADPWSLPLGAADETVRPELLVWLEAAGPQLGGLRRWRAELLPADLTGPLDDGETPPSIERLAELLNRAAAFVPELREALGARRDLAAQLSALRARVADGDGLVPAADQRPSPPAGGSGLPAGWAATELSGSVSHHQAPASFDAAQHLPGGPAEALRVFVASPLPGVAPWPGQTPQRTIDLRAPGLPPQSFDLATITGPGPWFVLLPTRAAAEVPGPSPIAGIDALTQRLARVADAASTAAGGAKVALIAHGSSALPARQAAALAPDKISHLVTLHAPLRGATFEFLDEPLAGEGIRSLQRLRGVLAGDTGSPSQADPLLDVLATLGAALDPYVPADSGLLVHVPFPAEDFAASQAPLDPAGLDARAVVGRIGAEQFDLALAWLVRGVLERAIAAPSGAPVVPARARAAVRLPVAAGGSASGDIAIDASVRLDVLSVPLQEGATVAPLGLSARVRLGRVGGWLAGGPGGAHPSDAPRDPRVRWAELELDAGVSPLDARVSVVLHDVSVFGRTRRSWQVDRDLLFADDPQAAGPLPPELRVLIGEVARAVGQLPATGPLRALADLGVALSLVSIDADRRVSVPAEPLERLLADPVGELRARLSDPAARQRALEALARLAAGTLGDSGAFELPLPGGLLLELLPGPPAALRLSTGDEDLFVGDLAELFGWVSLDTSGRVAGEFECAPAGEPGPDGRTAVVAAYDSTAAERVRVRLERGGAWELEDGSTYHCTGERIEVYPLPDVDALLAHGFDVLVGELLRGLIEAGVGEGALGGRRLRSPLGLLRDPGAWLLHPTVFGVPGPDGRMVLSPASAAEMLDAVRDVLGLPGDPGTLPLPFGLELALSADTSKLRVALRAVGPIEAGGAELSGALGVSITPAGGVTPAFSARVALPDLTPPGGDAIALRAAALDVSLNGSVSAALRLSPAADPPDSPPPADVVIPLVPAQGLAALATLATDAALQHVLPSALNGIARATVLKTGISAGDITLSVESPGGFPPSAAGSFQVAIGDERLVVTAGHGSPSWTVQRGAAGTTAATHAAGDAVYLVPSDLGLLPLAIALGELGDALDLRTAGRFTPGALSEFAKDPAGELLPRLRANADDALDAIEALAALVLPDQTVEVSGRTLIVTPEQHLKLTLAVPETDPLELCLEVLDAEIVDGIELAARVCASQDGLESLRFGVDVVGDTLAVAGTALHPFAQLLLGNAAVAAGDRFEAGLRLSETEAAVLKVPFAAAPGVVCRTGASDSADLTPCAIALVRTLLVPLLLDQLLSLEAVRDRLNQEIAGGKSLGDVLVGALVLKRSGTGYDLDPGVLDPAKLGDRVLAIGVQAVSVLGKIWPAPGSEPPPIRLELIEHKDGTDTLYGLRAELPKPLELLAPDGVKIDLEAPDGLWIGSDSDPGLEVLLLKVGSGAFDPSKISLHPWLRILGVGVRASGGPGKKLVDSAASIDAVSVHGVYDQDFTVGGAPKLAGGRVVLDGLTIPVGRASGSDNPVAAKLLSQGGEGAAAGNPTELAPRFSPQVIMLKPAGSPLKLRLRGGESEQGPWWLAIQRKFGPIYVEQVGFDANETPQGQLESVALLMDGQVSIAGLNAGLDDLSVTVPWATPFDLKTWKLGLAGIALGYDGGGVTLAGGFKKRSATPPDYVGMLLARFGEYGLTAIGGYAEYPTGEVAANGKPKTYTSLFVFAALSAPLGGPPAFFVTGIGAGAGINRRLVLPPSVPDVPSFPLVAAMDPQSAFAKEPMKALDSLGTTFPPERGALWFAAGVKFTSFALVESIAVLSVSIGDDLEVALLGLSRAALPRPEAPIANLELALRARFSAREAVLSIEAQLTSNSWLISDACKLTGGFAFFIWFRDGQFVLTLGGYHPSFAKPQAFPLVPRLGFNWAVTSEIVVKGEAYFALTATCVMAGGRLEASYRSGAVWAAFVVGMDAIVSWDPFFYDFSAYVSVSAGIEIKVCVPFLGCARIKLSLSIGASAHIWGPRLRGEAKLELQVVSVTVQFGAHGETEAGKEPIGWPEFREKYLVAGDPRKETMEAAVLFGELVAERAGGEAASAPTGDAGDPWLIAPEFKLSSRTRAASNLLNAHDLAAEGHSHQAIGLGPMGIASVRSEHFVTLKSATGVDVTASLAFEEQVGYVPEGVWRKLDGNPAPEAKVRPAFVGATLEARTAVAGDKGRVPLTAVDTNNPLPLPFAQEMEERDDFVAVTSGATTYIGKQPKTTAAVLAAAVEKAAAGGFGAELSPVAKLTYEADRVAAPQLAPLGEGMVDSVKPPVVTTEAPAETTEVPGNEVDPPLLRAILRGSPAADVRGPRQTTVSANGRSRTQAPRLTEERERLRGPGTGRLELSDPETRREGDTVLAGDVPPPTSVAGGRMEARADLRGDPIVAESVEAMARALAAGEEVPLTAGDVQVMRMPRAEFDTGEQRPALKFEGDQPARVVMLDSGGQVLYDRAGTSWTAQLPRGTSTIAVAGLGKPDLAIDAPSTGLAGWHAGSMIAQVSADAYVASGCSIRASSPDTLRSRQAAAEAMVRAGDAVRGRGVVSTRFNSGAVTVAIALETAERIDELLSGIVLGVEGAERAVEAGGEPLPPLGVVSGSRTYALYELAAQDDGAPVTVTVGSDSSWSLAGVFASAGSPQQLAGRLAGAGLDGLLGGLVTSPLGHGHVRYDETGGA